MMVDDEKVLLAPVSEAEDGPAEHEPAEHGFAHGPLAVEHFSGRLHSS